MPKWVAEAKAKKKKEEEKKTGANTRPQSSSVKNVNDKASKSTFLGGTGNANQKPKTVKKPSTKAKQVVPTTNTTAAQRQKMGVPTQQDLQNAKQNRQQFRTSVSNAVKQASSEENKGFMQRQKSGTLTTADKQKVAARTEHRAEVMKNTGAAAKKGAQDSITGYRKTMADLAEMTQSTDRATYGQAAKLGIDRKENASQWAKLETNRAKGFKQARDQRLALQKKQDERQAEWDERTKNAKGLEKALYGAAESGTGMLVDIGVGAATGTGQFGALASMGMRTYGTTRGSAEKEGATEAEDRLYSLLQTGKEAGTELMFPGAGLAKKAYGKAGLSLADKTANVLTKGLTGSKADIVGAGVRLLGGTAEENAEELAGWGLDPLLKEVAYGRNVRQRTAESLRANIPKITNQAEADNVAAYFNTSEFTDELTKEYRRSGLSDDEAKELASEMRDYYVAYYSGDQERLEELEDDLSRKLSGQPGISSKSWSFDELGETFAATTLLTMSTGLPGAVTTSVRGNQAFGDENSPLRQMYGDNAVKLVTDAVKNVSDKELSIKAEAMSKRLESGKDLTGTQKWDLLQGYQQKLNDTAKKGKASQDTVDKARREQDLVATMGVDRNGNRVYAKETQKEFNQAYADAELTVEAVKKYMESDNSISDDEARRADAVKKAVADLHVGGMTVGDAHEFAYGNTLAREALKAEEGIDLDQYIVRDDSGNVDYAATNEATENALYAINADNAIRAAQAETAVYIDDTRGAIDSDIMGRMGVNGQATWKSINKTVDPRNINEYLTTARAASYFYSAGRNTDMDMEDAINQYSGGAFRNIDKTALRRAFAAGSRDRIIANTPGYGQTVSAGSNIAMKKTAPKITGQLIMDEDIKASVPDTVQQAYIALAMSTNTNIYLKGDLSPVDKEGNPILDRNGNPVQLNGMSKGNDIYINVNASAEQNLGYVFMHEMTHQLKQYAPNEYMALENLVRDRWFNKNNAQMQQAIQSRIDLYKTKGGQSLTEEEAMEEIIADAMAEAMDDPNFAAQVCEEDINLGQAILNSIKAALRSIRQIFANDEFQNDNFHNGLLSYLGILDEAEKMWIEALHTARQNKANGLIADWQDNANRESRYSVSEEEDIERIKAKKRTNAKDREILRDAGEKLKESDFYKLYSAHKLDLRRQGNVADQIESIKSGGFFGDAGFGQNVVPSSINNISRYTIEERRDYLKEAGLSDEQIEESINRLREEPGYGMWSEDVYFPSMNETQRRYGGRKGETVMFVPEHHVYSGERVINGFKPFDYEVVQVERDFQPYYELYSKAYDEAHFGNSVSDETRTALAEDGIDITESGSAVKYSLTSWEDTDQKELLARLTEAGFEKDAAKKWLRQVNSIASVIYGDMERLNYEADQYQTALKPNSEYYYTLDLSTLCQKRRLYQGTYNAIMHKLVNRSLYPEDTVRLREMMEQMGLETPCGICYEESRKKNEGKFADTWLNGQTDKEWNQKLKEYDKKLKKYQKALAEYEALEDKGKKKQPKEPQKPERWLGYANMEHEDPYIPTLADVTTTDGRAWLREEHPEVLEAYLEYQKGRESANPKVSFTHTDYRGDILRMTATDIDNVKHIGGLRIQSFSDFETIHVIDMMQAIMDMAAMNLTSQAYTKVPAFADIFGGTGIKINLSLIQKMDENGNPVYDKKGRLVFDSKEGIDPKEAFRIRKKYSKNVGTILVGVSNQQILDAWADDRVDMVIPFHRSGWSLEEFERLGLKGYEDFQDYQSERYFDPKKKEWISLKDAKKEAIYSADYWDESLSGKENAERYLALCAEKHYRPVFYNFLKDNGDGTWSLQDDGSTDGYWKSLIDYKMYDNDGNFAPQEEVQPIFDMRAAKKVMAAYEGNADTLPVNNDVVEAYIKDYKERHPDAKIDYGNDARLSIAVEMDEAYLDAVNSGNIDEAQKLVDEAAKEAGFDTPLYHGTDAFGFTTIDNTAPGADGFSFWAASREDASATYTLYGKRRNVSDKDLSEEERERMLDEVSNEIDDAISEFRSLVDRTFSEWVFGQQDNSYLRSLVDEANPQPGNGDGVYDALSEIVFDAYHDYGMDSEMEFDDWSEETEEGQELWDAVNNIEALRGKLADIENAELKGGIYGLYANTDNLYELDAEGKAWNELRPEGLPELTGYTGVGTRPYKTRDVANWARENGYDGVRFKNIKDNGPYGRTAPFDVYAFFNPQAQVKSADTVTYAEGGSVIPLSERFDPTNNDIRYSLPTQDSDGNILTDGQMEYFKNSQARDIFGRLVPVYHVTPMGGFTVFDPSYSFDQRSISFTNDIDFALNYSSEDEDIDAYREAYETRLGDGETEGLGHYEVYLDMQNPYIVDGSEIVFNDEVYDLTAYAQNAGYDGLIIRNFQDMEADVYQVFSSNQIKDTRNENPSENPDIRYSITPEDEAKSRIAYEDAMDNSYELLAYYEQQLGNVNPETFDVTKAFREEDVVRFLDALKAEDSVPSNDPKFEEDRVRMAKSKEEFFSNVNAKWNDRWITEGEVLKISSVKRDITNLVKGAMANSNAGVQYRNDIVRKTLLDARLAYQLMKQDRTELASYLLYHSAQRMMEGLEFIQDDTAFQEYKGIRDYLRQYRINVPEKYWQNEKFLDFRKEYYGRLRIGKGNNNIESVYQDLANEWPHIFNESQREKADCKSDPDGLLQHIGVVVDSNVTPFYEAYSSEQAASLAFDLADQLYDIIANGDREVSLADSYKERFDEQTKAMKQRHYEAILRERKIREEGIQKERIKFRAYKEREKERQAHREYFDRIKDTHDTLVERLASNTADKHIPEQYKKELAKLLGAFDLQTVGSKKYETRTGHVAKNTIRMAAIKEALKNIEDRTEMFHVNDAITDIMDELSSVEGMTIDELSAAELKKIDDLLKSLLHEFNRYEKVKIGIKMLQAAELAATQIKSALEHVKLFGPGNDYRGPKGWLDQIINLDEMTPAYLFKRIDPDNEGLGLMWKEIRRSQDRYIRNTEQINKWVDEIIGKYHNRGRFGKKYGADTIEQWRSTNYTQTFNLTNGTVELTPAQMMSLYCLSKRNQAYGHMVGAGIVVAPVSFQAKIISDLKKKINRSLPVILTDADIKTITSALTPDQVKVADQLQELMSTKMADLGNEASMNVIGIKLFNETDYFPIKSDKAALERDLTNEQFENAIRNFGFTKAVQPGARNAIMVEDIFDVVTEHCNNMNLYNSYSETLNDFMKVFNKHAIQEDGADYSVRQALAHAYSQKAVTFIMEFVRDLNGNVSKGRQTGIETAMNETLANAKKASVFANLRVLAQQPTAITRAFAVIDPKYLKGVKIEKGAMKEMFEHCPIALWKSWGYYDINMGKSIESVIMNEGNWLEDLATQSYGAADNVTWTAIWQMVKAEMKDTHPDIKEGTEEYWEMCNERMSEIVDLTQVVDSPLHRSHAMRAKDVLHKTMTSFMAEPTLTFNMIRDGWIRAKEAWAKGDKAEAARIMGRAGSVALLQAATVASAAAVVDALRGKNSDGGDDDEGKSLWWINFVENFKDEMKIWNKVYYIKDLASIAEGWDNANLALQGWKTLFDGFRQFDKKLFEGSKTPWWSIYYNLLGGIGYFFGIPAKTLMRDGRAVFEMLGGQLPESLVGEEKTSGVVSSESPLQSIRLFKKDDKKTSSASSVIKVDTKDKWFDYENNPITIKDGSALDKLLNHFGVNLTAAEKTAIAADQKQKERAKKAEDINTKYADLPSDERDKKVWSAVTSYYKGENDEGKAFSEMVEEGNYGDINEMKRMYLEAGGNTEYFDERVLAESKKALKKSIKYNQTSDEVHAQERVKDYMLSHGMTEDELSEIVYKSDTAKDMKVAFRLNDKELMMESLEPLVNAGLSYDDLQRLWDNRNRMQLTSYKGRYKDKLKSTGKFIWPASGTITSHFGYRNAPTAGASSNHPAIDIAVPVGTPVAAADGGVVIYAGSNGGYGNSVGIKHDNGMVTYYNHLDSWNVKVGDTVAQGQQIASSGNTGISTGPHLDFKILDKNGKPVNPEKYLTNG